MEIKEEGTSEEGQHFLPTPQANEGGDFQLTGVCVRLLGTLDNAHWVQQTHRNWGSNKWHKIN